MLALLIGRDDLFLLPFLAPPLLLSLTVHEFAHARVALAFGDPTAYRAGRVSLNPLKHLDPLGTIAIFLIGFGWAKPVPVNPQLLRPPRLGDIMVSLAGPLSNFILAVFAGLVLRILPAPQSHSSLIITVLFPVLWLTLSINIVLGVFNLIPLFPLDGHHILGQLLPADMREAHGRFQRQYGMFILLFLLFGPRFFPAMPDPLHWLLDHAMNLARHITGPI